jgi:hypothetical protein
LMASQRFRSISGRRPMKAQLFSLVWRPSAPRSQNRMPSLTRALLFSDLRTAAQERGKRDNVKPFYVPRRIPTLRHTDDCRQFRWSAWLWSHLTMAHQFPNQLLDRGENGRRVYNSIMENASSKVVFRLQHDENLRAMAQ